MTIHSLLGRRRALLPPLAVGVTLAFAGAASAQTGFHATISSVTPKHKPCPSGEALCGTAITPYGPAAWSFAPAEETLISAACAAYTANVTFVLGDGSTLVLDENGTACQPGNALSAPGGAISYGNPFTLNGHWTVESADGRFGSVSGAGTDALHTAGARVTGTYAQTS
jgi:hypothetical protein